MRSAVSTPVEAGSSVDRRQAPGVVVAGSRRDMVATVTPPVSLRLAQWIRTHITLSSIGLELLYTVLVIATVIDANAMSIVYTLLLSACVVLEKPYSPRLWGFFSVLCGLLLLMRYFAYLGLPPYLLRLLDGPYDICDCGCDCVGDCDSDDVSQVVRVIRVHNADSC